MASNTVGRIRVRVLPDTSEFNRDLKKVLERAQARHSLHLGVDLELQRRTLAQVQHQAEALQPTIEAAVEVSRGALDRVRQRIEATNARLEADLSLRQEQARRQLSQLRASRIEAKLDVTANDTQIARLHNRLKDKFDDIKAQINANVDSGLAWAKIKWLTRPRRLPVEVEIAGWQKIGTALAALSGARVLKDFGTSMKNIVTNLDRSVPKIMAVTAALASLSAVGLHAAGGVIGVAGALAKVVPAGLAIPGLMAGAATGVAALALALKDTKTHLEGLGPAFERLQQSVSARFWGQAAAPIRGLALDTLPVLRRGLGQVAQEAGTTAAALARMLQARANDGAFTRLFSDVAAGSVAARAGIVSIASALTTLGEHGSALLPRLGSWVSEIGARFEKFIAAASASGRLDGWINAGIAAMKDFGGVIANAARILNGLHTAAQAAGTGGLAGLNAALGKIAAIVVSPAFQSTLSTVFAGAARGAEGLSAALGPVGSALNTLGPALANLLANVGTKVGDLISGIADALGRPEITAGIQTLVDGFGRMIDAILPALEPLSNVLAALAPIVADLAAQIGAVLAQAIITAAPIIGDLAAKIQPLIPTLGDALVGAINTLAPLFGVLADHAGALAVVFGGGLAASTAVGAIASVHNKVSDLSDKINTAKDAFSGLKSGFTATKDALVGLPGKFSAAATALAGWTKEAGLWVAQSVKTVAAFITEKAVMVGHAIATGVARAATMAMAIAQGALNLVMAVNPMVWVAAAIIAVIAGLVLLYNKCEWFRDFVNGLWEGIKTAAAAVATWFTDTFVPWLQGVWQSICDGVQAVVDWFTNAWNTVRDTASTVWQTIVDWITQKVQAIYQSVVDTLTQVKEWWTQKWEEVKAAAILVWEYVKAKVAEAIDAVRDKISSVLDRVKQLWNDGWERVKSTLANAWGSIRDAVTNGVGRVIDVVSGLPSRILNAIGHVGSLLYNAGVNIMNGLINGIKACFGALKSTFDWVTSWIPQIKGPPQKDKKLLYGAGRLIMEGFERGIESQFGSIHDTLTGFTRDLDFTPTFSGPGIAGLEGISSRLGVDLGESPKLGSALRPIEVNQYIQTAQVPRDSKLASDGAATARTQLALAGC